MRKVVVYSLVLVLALSWVFLPGVSDHLAVHAQEAAPELRRVRPAVITAGTRAFTIRLEGRRFVSGANVLFDGVALPSPRVSTKGRVLLAEVSASLIAAPGTHTIQAINPDGLTSPVETLTVKDQDPDLRIRLDGNAAQEDSGLIFLPTIVTDSLGKGDILVWGKKAVKAEVPGGVQIQIPEGMVNDPAAIPITLQANNGDISNTELFFIVPKPARIFDTSPSELEVGTE